MDTQQKIVMISMAVFGTMFTRFLPFVLFSGKRKAPAFIVYLGRSLPPAIFGMLVVFSLKDVNFLGGTRGIPELIAIVFIYILHKWKRQMLFSIAFGTLFYMFLIQFVF